MSYILSKQRDRHPRTARRYYKLYERYLRRNESRFPRRAYALATSDWYFSFSDHRAPHDAWLESAIFEEPAKGRRSELRQLSLRVQLLGAYHDKLLELFYPRVYSYKLELPNAHFGHYDWRYDEFRVNRAGHLIHEIEWAGPPYYAGRWLIVASDVRFSCRDRPKS